jgi:hypothetical protein
VTQGIQVGAPKLGYLHSELDLVLSQISRKEGHHWLAAWQTEVAALSVSNSGTDGHGFFALARAARHLRRGDAWDALSCFEDADDLLTATSSYWAKARIGRVKTLRLIGNTSEAKSLSNETLTSKDLGDRAVKELKWEILCCEVQDSQDPRPMLALIRPGKYFRESSFIIEAMLWTFAARRAEWLDLLPRTRTVARDKTLNSQNDGFFFTAVRGIELCYETDVPLSQRISQLGNLLSQTNLLMSVDKQLLVLAAAARWLSRQKLKGLLTLVLNDYWSISTRLTGNHHEDPLKLTHDLVSKVRSSQSKSKTSSPVARSAS